MNGAVNYCLMNNNKVLLMISMIIAVSFGTYCPKKGPDLSKFDEVCSRVVQCDTSLAVIPDPQNNCKKLMGGVEERLPAVLPQLTECLTTTPCEELKFQGCLSKHMQEIQSQMP